MKTSYLSKLNWIHLTCYPVILFLTVLTANSKPDHDHKSPESNQNNDSFRDIRWKTENTEVLRAISIDRPNDVRFLISGDGSAKTTFKTIKSKKRGKSKKSGKKGDKYEDVVFYRIEIRPTIEDNVLDGTIFNFEGAVMGFRVVNDRLNWSTPRIELLAKQNNPKGEEWIRGGMTMTMKKSTAPVSVVYVRIDRGSGTWDICSRENIIRADLKLEDGKAGELEIWPGDNGEAEVLNISASNTNFAYKNDRNKNAIPDEFETKYGYELSDDRSVAPEGKPFSLLELYAARNIRE